MRGARAWHRVILALTASVALLALSATPALAVPPETPDLSVESIKATEATFHGVLNPKEAAAPNDKGGTYKFLYKAGPTCTGGKETSPSGLWLGQSPEQVSEPVTGLTPETKYTVCLSVTNLEGQTTISAPVPFKTTRHPEAPEGETATLVTATTATLEGILNPKAAGAVEGGEYEFRYKASETECEERSAPETPGTAAGAKEEHVVEHLTGLEPHQKYAFCLIERNVAGEEGKGVPVSFETEVAPPSVKGESASPKAEEAQLSATVNPSNETTECHFQYGETSVTEHKVACEQGNPPGTLEGGEQGVSATVTGLKQNTPYKYWVVLKNATGEEAGEEQTFTTTIRPEAPAGLEANPIAATTATLGGVLNPNAAGNPGSYEFLYKQVRSDAQPGCEGEKRAPEPAGAALGVMGEAVSVPLTELLPNTSYTFCLRVRNTVGEETTSAPVTFTTLVAPLVIEGESSTVVSSTETQLQAQIYDGNSPAAFHFEYGPSAGDYTVSVPASGASTGAHLAAVGVSAAATGLTPGATYHWRVVASNSLPGQVDGADQTFTTPEAQGPGSPPHCENEQRRAEQPFAQALPDCRAYEIVSTNTEGQDAQDPPEVPGTNRKPRAAVSGEAIAYDSNGSFAQPAGSQLENTILSVREERQGRWSTRSIMAPETRYQGFEELGYFGAFFTPELTEGLTSTVAALGGEGAPEGLDELYRADFAAGSYTWLSHLPAAEEHARPYTDEAFMFAVGASEDLSHVAFAAEGPDGGILREWANGRVFTVGVSNTRQVWEAGVGNSQAAHPENGDLWHAVSADGSRVVFDRSGGGTGPLYVRQNGEREQSRMNGEECLEPAEACTIQVSPGEATYRGASVDDSRIFYTENGDLYEYSLEPGQVAAHTTALTHAGEIQGVVEISEDGSYVYFVANAVLTKEPNSQGEEPKQGACQPGGTRLPAAPECNLYAWHEGKVSFVASLAGKNRITFQNQTRGDEEDWSVGVSSDRAAVTPGGALLAFVSRQSLTGYNNEPAEPADCTEKNELANPSFPCKEVYLYDARTGSLVCASCNPTGARPVGDATLPTGSHGSDYRPRDLTERGALFFDSSDALVTHASDGRQNVYEYENGHVYPISNVAGRYESAFLDASADGRDVFFATSDQLLPEDTGNNVLVWDARSGGGFPVTVTPPACTNGDSCKPPVSPQPAYPARGVGTAAIFGEDNVVPPPALPRHRTAAQERAEKLAKALKACRKKHNKHKRQVCEKAAHKAYGAKASATKSAHHQASK